MNSPKSIVERYTDAATKLDAEALLALYAPNMRMFDLMMPWQIRGIDLWRGRVQGWFESTGDNPRVRASDVEVTATPEMALLTMLMEYSHVESNGKRFSMLNRLTWVLAPNGDDWQIVHEHTSVPVRESDMQPVFQPED